MSFSTPAHTIARWSVVGMEGMFVKMFDPPKETPPTPDMVAPTNPVPEVLAAAGFQDPPDTAHTVVLDLMHGVRLGTWDNRANGMEWFLFRNQDAIGITNDEYPSATLRVPQGVVFHCETDGQGPPPHTIHWHGHEPTPMNDGVGHCSMEIGHYVYQLQPQFIGTYFAHCHRNTVQHFEFGLFFLMLVEPKDAYFATLHNPAIPIGHCRDGRRRTAANLDAFPQFPDYNNAAITALDPWTGDPNLKFNSHPHAHTVAYDVEALWVLDDRDSTWSDLANNARATYPQHGTRPGFNDNFHNNGENNPAAPTDFFAFNDHQADYWYVTGVPVEANRGGSATIPANVEVPATLNSGVAGSQVSINGLVGQTILVRCLDAAYNSLEVSFPIDVVIIAWDGRALGVAPFATNHAYTVPAGTAIKMTTARRFDALIRVDAPVNANATVKFFDTRGQVPGSEQPPLMTARIPIRIAASHQIVATAGANGIVTPLGTTRIETGNSRTYTITPNPGYKVAAIVVDGVQRALANSFTFSNVTSSHTIHVLFTPNNAPTGTIVINGGAASTSSKQVALALSATAVSGTVTHMAFAKDGGTFFPFETFATTRTVTLTNGDGVKTVSVRFRDSSGRVSDPISDTITLITQGPTGSVVINGGAGLTNSRLVTLALSATAGAGATVTQTRFSKDGINYFPFETYATTRTVTLTAGDGLKNIWVQFKDSLGNISTAISDSITLDTTKPTGTMSFNEGANTSGTIGTLAISASDTNGVTQMQFSKNGGLSYFAWEPYASTRVVKLSLGPNTLTARFKDAAGNISDPVSASINRN